LRHRKLRVKQRLTTQKRKNLKYSYLNACYENQAIVHPKLKAYMDNTVNRIDSRKLSQVAPTRVSTRCGFGISAMFRRPVPVYHPASPGVRTLLFVLGLYVFQPIANKFAIRL
jgi:hypothetical protein